MKVTFSKYSILRTVYAMITVLQLLVGGLYVNTLNSDYTRI